MLSKLTNQLLEVFLQAQAEAYAQISKANAAADAAYSMATQPATQPGVKEEQKMPPPPPIIPSATPAILKQSPIAYLGTGNQQSPISFASPDPSTELGKTAIAAAQNAFSAVLKKLNFSP